MQKICFTKSKSDKSETCSKGGFEEIFSFSGLQSNAFLKRYRRDEIYVEFGIKEQIGFVAAFFFFFVVIIFELCVFNDLFDGVYR